MAQKFHAPLSYIVNTAPIFLGLFSSFAGRRQDKLRKEIEVRKKAEIELQEIRDNLQILVKERTKELEETQKQLLEVAHKAGMAEIATSVLHNIGNVLNSAITAESVISETVRDSKLNTFDKLTHLVQQKSDNFNDFIANDPKGQKLPAFLIQLNSAMLGERTTINSKLENLKRSHEHIRDIIALQHTYAGVSGIQEKMEIPTLIQDASQLFDASFDRHKIGFKVKYQEALPQISVEKNKALQIIVNLLKNARDAVKILDHEKRQITVIAERVDEKRIIVKVIDNGIGISPYNLDRIFNYGFTTKKTGHGFGLHGSANLATEIGGSLAADSDGENLGSTFSLILPI